jgi:hypothetical protein
VLSSPHSMWFYGQQIDELYIHLCMNFDVIFMPDKVHQNVVFQIIQLETKTQKAESEL